MAARTSHALEQEITHFNQTKKELEAAHMGEWVVICGSSIIGIYGELSDAARDAEVKCGSEQFLLRRVGFGDETAFPISVFIDQ